MAHLKSNTSLMFILAYNIDAASPETMFMALCWLCLVTSMIFAILILLLCTFTEKFCSTAKFMAKVGFFLSLLMLTPLAFKGLNHFPADIWQLNQKLHSLCPLVLFHIHTVVLFPPALLIMWTTMELSFPLTQTRKMSFLYMTISILAMIMIMYTKELIVIFIAWQVLMTTALLLSNMYYSGANVVPAMLYTFFCNQAGSVGFMLTYYWLAKKSKALEPFKFSGSLNFPGLPELPEIYYLSLPTLFFFTLLLAVTSSVMHLGLHRGLVAATDTPTPVLTFIHAVIIMMPTALLLLRFYPTFSQNPQALTTCLCLGAIIMLLSAAHTLTQSNLHKIINYPASGQLGLMLLTFGLNLPYLALFYTCIHMITKTALSLCSDLIVHPSGEKDIRNLQELQRTLPIIGLSAGSLILMLAPLIIPFCFKDTLIQAASTSWINLAALLLALTAIAFTVIYNTRLIYVLLRPLLKTPKIIYGPEDSHMVAPMIRLTCALALALLFIPPLSAEGHLTSLTTPAHMKLAILVTLAISLVLAYLMALFFWLCVLPRIPYLWTPSDPLSDMLAPPRVLNSIQDLVTHLKGKAPKKAAPAPFFPFPQPALPQRIRVSQSLLIKLSLIPVLAAFLIMSLV